MDSEIMQLEPCHGYLKLADRADWLRLSFKPTEFSAVVDAYVPAGRSHT
jgi:hypothetical protein